MLLFIPDAGKPDPHRSATPDSEARLIEALRHGDEAAFATLIELYHPALVRLAMIYVSTRAVAEEVAQETWLGVLQGIHQFGGRSSLKTWIFRILSNRAKTRAEREGRSMPFSDLENPAASPAEPAVDPSRFQAADAPWPHHWVSVPQSWDSLPEQRLLSQETGEHIRQAIATLSPSQRAVIILRDIEGWSADEVCNMLGVSETNQRVLLHRARSRVRQALEHYFAEE